MPAISQWLRLGVASVAEKARAAGRQVPPLVETLLASGGKSFYVTEGSTTTVFGHAGAAPRAQQGHRGAGDGLTMVGTPTSWGPSTSLRLRGARRSRPVCRARGAQLRSR